MKKQVTKRAISLLLVAVLLMGFAVPISASHESKVTFTKVDNDTVSAGLPRNSVIESTEHAVFADTEMVRVSIVLKKASTLEAGYSTHGIGDNAAAMSYRDDLRADQAAVTTRIEGALGRELDVVWNLTLAANVISANVEYGSLASISQVPGVEKVILEARYEPKEAVNSAVHKPNMMVSANMTGAVQVWESGFTGGGARIAIIDTGLDYDHQSFDSNALAHALAENAEQAGMSYEEYLAHIDLLDVEELTEKLPRLNLAGRAPEVTAEELYLGLKSPFAYNYVDMDLDVTHDNDTASEHGSHVAGIAAANRYIRKGNSYVSAADAVATLGNAPDAQIITMKVFGKMGGAYDSDYMAAIEDAIILGCEVVNLSLGTTSPGFVTSPDYQELMDYLVKTDTVVAIAAGNEGYWAVNSAGAMPNLYIEDVNFQTAGAPGTYANAFTVASVENDGSVSPSLRVAGNRFGYRDGDGTWNEPVTSLDTTGEGTEYEYVFLDGLGVESDYTGIDVTGKIVFVSRGETNFADKAKIAVSHGAIATIIYNNILEGINMDLTGYYEEAPCAIITMAKGQLVRENSTAATTDGGMTYYTGKVTVCSEASANVEDSDFYTMSSFSSWGVPGDLTLKPEITAPGGNIYSVNGAVAETDQYELMSGTSMATPQVAGFSALVQQFIHENGLSQEGMTDRALTQSLLMSTAVPLKDAEGRYYPVIQQGAGLVDILAATSADSYVTVDGQPDGKVKVELGDDPQRIGAYTLSFELNNLDDQEKIFALSADMFTQDAFVSYANKEAMEAQDDSVLAAYLDTATRSMGFTADWSTDGEMVLMDEDLEHYDFDGDGDWDEDDAQALLDYVTGARETVNSQEYADVSGDGDVDTYDVHVLMTELQGKAVVVPADSTVKVTVTLTLTEQEKAYLDTYYINGAYVQAFVFADAITDSEGVNGTCHSIPVLGFYGGWTDSSMFEVGTVQAHATGEEIRDPYTDQDAVNSLSVEYAADPGYVYYLGGNPVVTDSVYRPERNAFNHKNGDKINSFQFNPIRNVYASRMTVTNTASGEVLKEYHSGSILGAYYGVVFFMQMWLEGAYDYPIMWAPKNVAEGDTLEFRVDAAPEYYVDAEGNVDWDALGSGATLRIPLTMDSTAPEISGVSVDVMNNTLEVEASDNRYVAGVALFDGSGKNILTYVGSKEEAVPAESYGYELDLSKANGGKFLVQVYDYAYNVTTYELRMDLGDVPPLPDMIAFDKQYDYYWTTFTLDSWYRDLSIYSESDVVFNAATIDSHYVFACTTEGDLYVMPETDLADMNRIRNLGVVLNDMAYNRRDDKIYGVAYNTNNESVLYTIDKMVGTLTEVGVIGLNTNTLACDNNGVFYCNEYGTSKVYSFTLDTMDGPAYMMEVENEDGVTFTTMGVQAMEYNPNTGNVVWTSYYYEEKSWGNWGYSYLYEIHPGTNTYTRHNDLTHQLAALVIPQSSAGGEWTAPTDEIMSLELSHETMSVLKGNSDRLTVTVLPWTVTDRTVTWTSADPAVAEVNQYGLVTGVTAGTTTITATSNLNPSFSDSVMVTVEALPIEMEGVIHDYEGNPSLFTWDMVEDDTWTAGVKLDTEVSAAAEGSDGNLVVVTGDGTTMKSVDVSTGVSSELGSWGEGSYIYDMAYSKLFSDSETDRFHMISGSFWLPAKVSSDTTDDQAWDLFDYIFDNSYAFEFVAIAVGNTCTVEDGGQTHEAEELFLLDDNGYVWKLCAYADGDFYNATEPVCYPSTLGEAGYAFTRLEETMLPLCSMVMGADGNLYFSGYNGTTNVFYQLSYNEATESYDAVVFANAGEDVWPAVLTNVTARASAANGNAVYKAGTTLTQSAHRVHLSEQAASEKLPLRPLGDNDDVTVTVQNEMDATNGLFTVTYDAEKLTLKTVESHAYLTSTVTDTGSVVFGYAGMDVYPAGSAVAELTFQPNPGTTTDVRVTITQVNDEKVEIVQTVTIALPDSCSHASTEVRNAVDATCTEDGYTGDTYCTACGELLQKGEVIPANCPSAGFKDVAPGTWYHAYIDYAVERKLMIGMDAAVFAPEAKMSRGQIVTVLYRLAGAPQVENKTTFQDVAEGQFYTDAVAWAYENGITKGITEERFAPYAPVTREQVVAFFARYAVFAGHTVEATGTLDDFTDAGEVDGYVVEAMTWAVENGIINGMGTGRLNPNGTSTRAQVGAVLMRFCELYE